MPALLDPLKARNGSNLSEEPGIKGIVHAVSERLQLLLPRTVTPTEALAFACNW